MSTVFGEVASLYDAVRPDLPSEIAGLVLSFAGHTPTSAAEIGAGTGKATALFAGRGFPIICVEPDPRMAARLRDRLPDADLSVVESTFEDWQPPANGVDLLYASLSWHWLARHNRAALAVRALASGGTLALIGRKTWTLDEATENVIRSTFDRFPPAMPDRPPLPDYALPELAARPELTDLRAWTVSQHNTYDTEGYVNLQLTFSPFRSRPPEILDALVDALRIALNEAGGVVRTRLDTHVVLAHRL